MNNKTNSINFLNIPSNDSLSISETLWEHLQLKSSIRTIRSFAKAIFNTSSYKTLSNYQISNSCLIQFFFGISLPLAERITFIIKGSREDLFIEEHQFLELVELIYKGSIRSKLIFFFKIFDYHDQKILTKINVVTLFMHINSSALELINDLFKEKEEMTFSDFLTKQQDNMDLVLFFYFYLHQQRKVNDNILKVYNSIMKDANPEFHSDNNGDINNEEINSVIVGNCNNNCVFNIEFSSDMEIPTNMKEDSTCKSAKKKQNSFIGILQAQEKEKIMKRQLTSFSKGDNSIKRQPLQHSKTTEILNTELIPKNTKKFYKIVENAFGIDARKGSFPDMPQLNPKRKDKSTISLLNENCDDLNELEIFENDIKNSLAISKIKSIHKYRFIKNNKRALYKNGLQNGVTISVSEMNPGKQNKILEIFNPKITNSFQYFDEEANSKQTSITIKMTSTLKKKKTFSFNEYNHSNIIQNDDFLSQYDSETKNPNLNISNENNEFSLTMKYSVYDYQFHFGILFLIGQFIFFLCGKKKDKSQNIVYSLLIDKTFIKNDEKDLIQIILPFGEGQLYTFRFNSIQKKNEFLYNIGFNTKFLEKYSLIKEIASGKFGTVWKSLKNKKEYAIKIINKKGRYKLSRREVYINEFLIKHKHKNIIDIEELYENGDNIYIVMEYIKDGILNESNIHNILTKSKNSQIISEKILKQIIEGVGFLHEYGIVHRDIKFENILIKEDDSFYIKITDFGLSTFINNDETIFEKCGTIMYTAPEILNKNKYNKNVDLWSIGIIAYYLQYKQFPFSKIKMKDINNMLNEIKSIVDGINTIEIKQNFLLNVITSCLIKSHVLRKGCKVLLENYVEYINNKENS